MKIFSCFILLLILFPFCGPKQTQIEKITEDGVEVIINHLEPYKMGEKNTFRLEKLFGIDSEDKNISALGIPDIFGFIVNSKGEIFILRSYAGENNFIFKFDKNGNFVNSFGPQGQGPGEFQNPHHLALDSMDNIVIIDIVDKLIKYDKNGTFINTKAMSSGDYKITSGPRKNVLVQGSSYKRDKETAIYSFNLKLYDPDLEMLQVIDEISFEFGQEKTRATEPIFCWSSSQDNVYVVNEDRGYDIWVYDSKGKLIRKIQKEYKPIPISEDFKQKIYRQFPQEMRESMKNMVYFPEFHPPIQGLAAGDDGTLLVSTFEDGENPGEFMFDVFNQEGVFIGRKSLNTFIWEGHLWAQISGNKFYCLEEKENGYKELVVYKMI